MKNVLLTIGLLSLLVLAGCSKDTAKVVDAQKVVPVALQQEQAPVEAPVLFPPSLDDGDYYFKARAENNLVYCEKIANQELKAECLKEFKK